MNDEDYRPFPRTFERTLVYAGIKPIKERAQLVGRSKLKDDSMYQKDVRSDSRKIYLPSGCVKPFYLRWG